MYRSRLVPVFLAGLAILASTVQTVAAEGLAYFGQTPPGLRPQRFAPGAVSLPDCHEFGITFSSDGMEAYFSRRVTQDWSSTRVFASRLAGSTWKIPAPADFAAAWMGSEPHLTLDGRTLYFGWAAPPPPGISGESVIWAVDRKGAGWSTPRCVGAGMFVSTDRAGNFYVMDEYPRFQLCEATLANGRIASRKVLTGGMGEVKSRYRQVAHPCIAPDGSYILFDVDGSHTFVCFRGKDGSWGQAFDLAERGLPADAGIPSVTADGKYLFFTSQGDIWWVGTGLFLGLRR